MQIYQGNYKLHSTYRNVDILVRTRGSTVSKYLIKKRGGYSTIKAAKEKIDLLWSEYPSQMEARYDVQSNSQDNL